MLWPQFRARLALGDLNRQIGVLESKLEVKG